MSRYTLAATGPIIVCLLAIASPARAGTVAFSTYFGGSGDTEINAVTTDSAGNTWVAGQTSSSDLPTTPGAFQRTRPAGGIHAFVAKFSSTGALLYSTFLAGSGNSDIAYGIAVDSQGNAYVTGQTNSPDFPVTAGAFSTINKGVGSNGSNAFITELNPAGSALIYSTYIGGTNTDAGNAIAVDAAGEATITGQTNSPDFPFTVHAFQTAPGGGFSDAFVTRLNAAGTALVYSTFLGGNVDDAGYGIAVDANGNAYIAGSTGSPNFPTTPGAAQSSLAGLDNAFATALNANGTALLYSTYLGGTTLDVGLAIAVDSSAHAWLTGYAGSADFPVTAGAMQPSLSGPDDAFVSELGTTGNLLYSTFLGGPGDDYGTAISLDPTGNPWIAGDTNSSTFPLRDAPQTSLTGASNVFVTELSAAGALAFSTYLGGSITDLAYGISASAAGSISVGGYTTSPDFPVTSGTLSGTSAAFLTVFTPPPSLAITSTHNGNFTVGQNGATYSLTVSNNGAGPTSGQVTVTDTLPSGLTATSINGSGWTCLLGSLTCTRSDALPIASSYPTITVTVNVTTSNTGPVSNQVSVSGGNSPGGSGTDITLIAGSGTTAQQITVTPLGVVPFSSSPLALSATASSGLPVTFYSTTSTVCTVSGNSLTFVSIGTCSVTAVQPGNATYSAAPSVILTLTILQASQTITFPSISPKTAGYQFSAAATASSGLPVTFASTTESVCTVSGTLVTLIAAGNCTLAASQAGNPNYLPGASVSQTFSVSANSGSNSGPTLSASPATLAFTWKQGAAMPSAQSVSITSGNTFNAFTAFAVTSSGGNWLTVSVPQNVTPGSISVGVAPSTLDPGTYNGTVIASSTSVGPVVIPITLTVEITVSSTPLLSVSPPVQRFVLSASSAPVAGSFTIANIGGAAFSYQVSTAAGNWLTLTSGTFASIGSGSSRSMGFSVNPAQLTPGIYSGNIQVSDNTSNTQQQVAVILVISQSAPSIGLSQSAFTFAAPVGGSRPPSQSFAISNPGSGLLNWSTSVQTLSGGNWLSVSPSSGSSAGGEPGTPVAVTADASGLAPGQYYGSISIASSSGANSSQTVSVRLNVLTGSGQETVGVSTLSGGAVFVGAAANDVTVTRQIAIFNPYATAVTLSVAVSPANSWLSVTPSVMGLAPGANTLNLTADFSILPPGVQTATVSLAFSDFTSATIQAVAIALPTSVSTASLRTPHALKGCVAGRPSSLVSVFDQPIGGSALTAGVAAPVQVELFDDCGKPVTSADGGLAEITFGTADPAIALTDTGGGIWQGTWNPAVTGKAVSLQLNASEGILALNPTIPSLVSVTVLAAPANAAPRATGIVNAAAGAQATPQMAAPSSYIAIYGSNLTAGVTASASTLPLPAILGGTQVFIGGQAAPLLYASPGQINAVVPQNLITGQTYPLLIVSGVAQSVPSSLSIARYQPGVYTFDASGSGQAIAEIAGTSNLASSATPATRGADYLQVFATGLGPVAGPNGEAPPADGAAASSSILYSTTATVTATLGGVDAPVQFAGLTPTLVSLYQVNIQVPADAPAGDAVPLVITVTDGNGVTISSNTTTVALQ